MRVGPRAKLGAALGAGGAVFGRRPSVGGGDQERAGQREQLSFQRLLSLGGQQVVAVREKAGEVASSALLGELVELADEATSALGTEDRDHRSSQGPRQPEVERDVAHSFEAPGFEQILASDGHGALNRDAGVRRVATRHARSTPSGLVVPLPADAPSTNRSFEKRLRCRRS